MERTLVINAGGESRRIKESMTFPFSKSWLIIDKKPIIVHNLLNLASEVKEIIIITRDQEELTYFENKINSLKNEIKIIVKKIKILSNDPTINISGPVRGLLTAVKQCQTEIIWWIPSDHPFITSAIFEEMEAHLKTNNIVSIFSERNKTDFRFEPQVFTIYKETFSNYSSFVSNRISNIYRIIPDIVFITPSSIGAEKSLIGINTASDLKLLNNNKETLTKQQNEIVKITRYCTINNKLDAINDSSIKLLYDKSQFFLIWILIELEIIKDLDFSKDELLFLDWKLWKNKNRIIALNCGKDYLKLIKLNNKNRIIVLDYLKKYS